MTGRFILVLILICTGLTGLRSEAADLSIRVYGADDVNRSEIRRIAGSAESDSAAIQNTLDFLRLSGYPKCSIRQAEDDASGTVLIEAGPAYTLGKVEFTGDSIPGSLVNQLQSEGDILSRSTVDRIASKAIDSYTELGFPFVQVSVDRIDVSSNRIGNLRLRVASGPQVRFDTCRIEGARVTTSRFLSRVSGIDAGDLFSDKSLGNAEKTLREFSYIRLEDSVSFNFRENSSVCVPTFRVSELPANVLEGSVGYQPAYANQSGFVRGNLRLDFENIFGHGRRFSFRYSKKDPYSHSVSLGYYQPYVFYLPLSASGELSQARYDSLYQTLALESTLKYGEGRGIAFSVSGGWAKYTPQGSEFRGMFHARRWWWGVGTTLRTDGIDFSQKFDLKISYGTKQQYAFAGEQPTRSRISDTRLNGFYSADLRIYKRLAQRFTAEAAALVTDEELIPPSDLYRIGGAATLRGYREEQFLCERFLLVKIQPSVRLASNASFHLFSDLAWLELFPPESSFEWGAGGGFDFLLATGRLIVDVAWGREDDFGSGKLYVTLSTRF